MLMMHPSQDRLNNGEKAMQPPSEFLEYAYKFHDVATRVLQPNVEPSHSHAQYYSPCTMHFARFCNHPIYPIGSRPESPM